MAAWEAGNGLMMDSDGQNYPAKSSFDMGNEDSADYCRICRGEATDKQPLFYPCKCSGSIKYVHQDCLMEWLSHSQKKHCELCKTPFRFTKLYDQSMPSKLPFPLFIRQLMVYAAKTGARWTRYLIVSLIWTCCLPWFIRQVWRGLFWMIDGHWASSQNMQESTSTFGNWTRSMSMPSQSYTAAATGMSTTDAIHHADDHVEPSLLHLVFQFLSFLTGESVIAKILRAILPMPIRNDKTTESWNSYNETLSYAPTMRQASVLSDVRFINSLTSSPTANDAFIDILEGQLICIVLIAAFILVFLIREWVINQQPILNMPDPDIAENPVAPAVPDEEARQPARRRRRLIRRAGDQIAPPEDVNQGVRPRPIAIPRPRRALTEDNIMVPTSNTFERPNAPPRSRSAISTESQGNDDLFSNQAVDRENSSEIEQIEPPPLMRGALGHVVNIQRTIEEASVPIEQNLESNHNVIVIAADAAPMTQNSTPDSTLQISNVETERNDLQSNTEETTLLPTDAALSISHQDTIIEERATEEALIGVAESDSDDIVILTPNSADSSHRTGEDVIENENERPIPEPTTDPREQTTPSQSTSPSISELIAAWLWQTDDYVAPPVEVLLQDDQQLVGDPQAEAPFVPAPQRPVVEAPLVQQNALMEQALEPPAIQAGGGWNDVNAVDDVEDLDGILELIGMEGPISGMIQNVLFSVLLITLTLTTSIWIPYIWGKITLLFLAHPVKVFIKAPLFILAKGADVVADIIFLIIGFSGFVLHRIGKVFNLFLSRILPSVSRILETEFLEDFSTNLSHSSGMRLEKTLTGTVLGLRPDLPTFSMQSHYALNVFKAGFAQVFYQITKSFQQIWSMLTTGSWNISTIIEYSFGSLLPLIEHPRKAISSLHDVATKISSWPNELETSQFQNGTLSDQSLAQWSTQDKLIAIILGYMFFALAGIVYLELAHFMSGLKDGERVEGTVADTLRQAGGVMKVILIIGIEMIIFPLYCGLLLDMALLPLFDGATVQNRFEFLRLAPFTGVFIHWFIGTCYMFHFALFVSMCRKIIRKGVLYFIRDPDDPTFHPVRDVLERPVPSQLSKIASSALVYGGLVIMCLGGVIWILSCIKGVLPIRWADAEPRLSFPADVMFYNFMLPFIIRKVEPSKKIAMMYEWWFRGCASGLRLSHFLFGEERLEEKRSHHSAFWSKSSPGKDPNNHETEFDGTYVRTPASDSVRIPRGQRVFLEVDENNQRQDGQPDQDKGMHGKNDDRFTKVYIPPQFRTRIVTFVILVWVFAAGTGVAVTIGPLLVGRKVVKILSGSGLPSNDLYALTVGIHICAGIGYCLANFTRFKQIFIDKIRHWLNNTQEALPQLWNITKYIAGLTYLLTAFGIVLPFSISLVTELYLHVPLFTYLTFGKPQSNKIDKTSSQPIPAVFILQTWTLGLLYLRIALRIILNYPNPNTRAATAVRAITRNGILHPDVRLASRAVILPASILCFVLLAAPLTYAKTTIMALRIQDAQIQMQIYRFAYPLCLGIGLCIFGLYQLQRQLSIWRVKIRDEVYLIGERLHNFQEPKHRNNKGKAKAE